MTAVRLAVLTLIVLLSLVGCATRPPAPAPIEALLPHRSPQSLLVPLDRHWHRVSALRAMARLAVTSPEGRYSTRQTFLWQRPSLLRLDVVSVLGQPAMTLVADAQQAAIYYPQQGVFFHGPATAANLARFIGLPLDAQDVAHLLTGDVRLLSQPPGGSLAVQVDRGAYLVRFLDQAGELVQDLWIESDQELPSRVVRYTTQAVPVVDVSYTDFRVLTEAFSFPFQVVVWLPQAQTELRLQYLAVDLNPDLPDNVFQLSPPTGVRVAPLE